MKKTCFFGIIMLYAVILANFIKYPFFEFSTRYTVVKNETVLDFTMGSGSTGVASKNLNRNFIGIEKDQKYFELAKSRIHYALI